MRKNKYNSSPPDSLPGALTDKNLGRGWVGQAGFFLSVLFILLMVIISGIMLHQFHGLVESELRNAMTGVVASTGHSLDHWLDERMAHVEIWAATPELRREAQALLPLDGDSRMIRASRALAGSRRLFLSSLYLHGYLEFFIVSPEHRVLAQLGDSFLGANFPSQEVDSLLARVFAGQSTFTLPVRCRIDSRALNGGGEAGRPGMFFAAPLKNEQDEVVAALLLYSDPETGLSSITDIGAFGRSGQVFAFDGRGRLISLSRFTPPHSDSLGLDNGILSLELRDPGAKPSRINAGRAAAGDSLPFTRMAGQALDGRSGIDLEGYRDLRGVPVVGAWLWDKRAGCGLALEITREEAFSSYRRIRTTVLTVLVTTVIMFLGLSLVLHRSRKEALRLARQSTLAGKQLQREIEVRRQVEDSLRESDAYIRAVVDSVVDGIITTDENLFIETFNPAAEKIFGYISAEVRGQNLALLFDPSMRRESDRDCHRPGRNGECPEMLGRRKDGSHFPVEFEINEMCLGSRNVHVGILRDITERKKYELELRRLSSHDGLTSIANRRHFDDILQTEWNRGLEHFTPLSLILLDIDHFKAFNDTYGHQAGDECLIRVAGALRDIFHRPADLPARYGGEEFAVILPETGLAGALIVAEKVRLAIEQLCLEHAGSPKYGCVTVSLGVSCLTPDAGVKDGPSLLIAEADRALYRAKDSGRNCVVGAIQENPDDNGVSTELADGIAH
ncbi:diguanylate cyclase [bacterium]|nr:diguanylate cyclase [bacterium]